MEWFSASWREEGFGLGVCQIPASQASAGSSVLHGELEELCGPQPCADLGTDPLIMVSSRGQ